MHKINFTSLIYQIVGEKPYIFIINIQISREGGVFWLGVGNPRPPPLLYETLLVVLFL